MRIITGHYHLNPGGVTKIIQSQLNGIAEVDSSTEVVVVFDGQGRDNISTMANVSFQHTPEIGYLPTGLSKEKLIGIYERILLFFQSVVTKEDIFHFHNIGLGKNPLVSLAIYNMAEQGYKIINHAHDFPEDRPVNLQFIKDVFLAFDKTNYHSILYPEFDNFDFGVLNSFDQNRLLEYGIPESRISLWSNPVNAPSKDELLDPKKAKKELLEALDLNPELPIVTYPVRAIRRKNIGEFILLAKLFKGKAHFMITLPPLNPVEIEPYNEWVEFCKTEDIPLVFEAGMKASFLTVMAASDFCFTTSIMEGFGMVFVEPWLWGNPVAGRSIPAVIPDIKGLGVDFPLLYEAFSIDGEDFGYWSMEKQMNYIKGAGSETLQLFLSNNPQFNEFLTKDWSTIIKNNAAVIKTSLSEKQYGTRLFKKYKAIS